jgi:hypothetical protein
MRYVNNWTTQLTAGFSPGDTELPLSGPALDLLAPGEYVLTLVNSANPIEQSAWEIVRVAVAGGSAVITLRGQEGTAEQAWLAGAVVYCAVTAGAMNQLFEDATSLNDRATTLEEVVAELVADMTAAFSALTLRVIALEGGTPPDPGDPGGGDLLIDQAGNSLTDEQNQPLAAGTV